jgi:hypothetical protein
MTEEVKEPTKLDQKRAQIYQDRRRRLLNSGVPEDKVDATIRREDYERLPVERKITYLESVIIGLQRGLSDDLIALERNDGAVMEALDINFTAFEAMLVKLGISADEQKSYLDAAKVTVAQKREAQAQAREAAMAKQQAAAVEHEIDQAGEPPAPPEEATVFGG